MGGHGGQQEGAPGQVWQVGIWVSLLTRHVTFGTLFNVSEPYYSYL